MANFNITVTKKPSTVYQNTRAIAFFNVFRGSFSYDDTPVMARKKINPEVLLRDIIVNDDYTVILFSNVYPIEDNSDKRAIKKATIRNPNLLDKIVFKFKDSYFEGDSVSGKGSIPADLLTINNQNVNLSLGSPLVYHDISGLHQLFVKNYDADKFLTNAERGFIDIAYNFTIDGGPVDSDDYNWSILRIQFGFPKPSGSGPIEHTFNQISIIRESDFNSEVVTNQGYGLPCLKGTNNNGDIAPLHLLGANAPNDTYTGIYILDADRVHKSGNGPAGALNFHIGYDFHNKYNFLNPSYGDQFSSAIDDLTFGGKNIFDILESRGRMINFFPNQSEYDHFNSWHAFAVIDDTDYIPLN